MLRCVLAALLLTALPASAQTTDCRVIGIADGNVFSCRTAEGDRLRVRMAEIDAPELKQPYGAQARQALSGYVSARTSSSRSRVATTRGEPWLASGPGTPTSTPRWSAPALPGHIVLN